MWCPPGSILGPVTFVIYVNDIPDIITSTAKLFADDTKSYREINNVKDPIALHIDLTTLHLWADRWQTKFDPPKCEVMHFSAFCKLAEKYFLVGMNSLGTLRRVYWEWLYPNSSSWCSLEATHFYFS